MKKTRLFPALAASLLFVSFFSSGPANKTASLHFNETDLTYSKKDGYDVVSLPEPAYLTAEGEPMLPVKVVQFLIPNEVRVGSIRIVSTQEKRLEGEFKIYPAQPPQPVQIKGKQKEFVLPQAAVYNSSAIYPKNIIEISDHGFSFGYHLVALQVCPVRYVPLEKKLYFLTEINFALEYEPLSEPVKPPERCSASAGKEITNLLKGMVENKEDIELQAGKLFKRSAPQLETKPRFVTEFPSELSSIVEYVIITAEPLTAVFEKLAAWKIQKGVPTVIKTLSWIQANYPGVDAQEKIRNFIKHANLKWGTMYVLLGGDTSVIPARNGLYDKYAHWYCPTDLYYSGLGGNWNANGNGIFGEDVDEVDYSPDIFIGRAPVESVAEAANFVNKVMTYEKTPDWYYVNNALMMGAHLGGRDFEGQKGKDYVSEAIPNHVTIHKLYVEYEDSAYRGDEELNRANAISNLNSGQFHLINHYDHCAYYSMGTGIRTGGGEILRDDMLALTNGPNYSILWSHGCSSNAFDREPSISENFINNPYGGGVAFIGNTVDVPINSQKTQDRQFFSSLYESALDHLGSIFASTQGTAFGFYSDYVSRATNLLGDPTMPVWTNTPQTLVVTYPSTMRNGENQFRVTVSNLSPNQEALVCLQKDEEDYAYGETQNGAITFSFTPNTPGTLQVTVTARNFIPYEARIPVTLTDLAHLHCTEQAVDDDTVNASDGNNDHVVNAGETIEMLLTLRNSGAISAGGVSATLTASSPYVTIIQTHAAFGAILPGQSSAASTVYVFTVDRNCPDETSLGFVLNIADGSGNAWTDEFRIECKAPRLMHTAHRINDTSGGNGNGRIENGETIILGITLSNFGAGAARQVIATLSTAAINIHIDRETAIFKNLSPRSEAIDDNAFQFSVTGDWTGTEVLNVEMVDKYGKLWTHHFDLTAPAAPQGLNYAVHPDHINLNWVKNNDRDMAGYNIYRSAGADKDYERLNFHLLESATSYADFDAAAAGIYYYKITAQDSSANESEYSQVVKTTIRPHAGWPVHLSNGFVSSPVLFDIDNNGSPEILTSAYDARDYVFHADGTELLDIDNDPATVSGIVIRDKDDNDAWTTPAIGDIDRDGEIEMVSTTYYDTRKVFAWELYDGDDPDLTADAVAGFWPIAEVGGTIVASPTLFDLDNDGDLEIILVNHSDKLFVWHHDGTPAAGCPIVVGTGSSSTPAVADLNKDGYYDIVWGGYDSQLHALSYNFTAKTWSDTPGFPVSLGNSISASPALGDLDDDGELEIAVATQGDIHLAGKFFVLESNGTVKWSNDILVLKDKVTPSPAICDLDSDSELEIVFKGANKIYAWESDGQNVAGNWPIPLYAYNDELASVVIGDIDGLGNPEILFTTRDQKLYAFHSDGTPMEGFPISDLGYIWSTPALGDIDNDGKTEIIVTGGFGPDNLYVWDTEGDAAKIEWGMFHHDAWHTGVYGFEIPQAVPPIVWSGTVDISADYVVPENQTLRIAPGTTLKFAAGTTLEIHGALKALGAEQDSILFTSAGRWEGVRFSEKSTKNELKYCRLERTSTGIHYNGSRPAQGGLDMRLLVDHCTICNFQDAGIKLWYAANTNIANSDIYYDTLRTSHHGTAIGVLEGKPTISGNLIYNVDYGIWLNTSLGGQINNNLILDFFNNGIYCGNSEIRVINNIIDSRSKALDQYPFYEISGGHYLAPFLLAVENNVIIAYESSPRMVPAIYCEPGTDAIFDSLCFNRLRSNFANCKGIIHDNYTSGTPGFVNYNAHPPTREAFQLTSGSSYIDKGNPNPTYNDWAGLGEPRNDLGVWGGPRIPAPIINREVASNLLAAGESVANKSATASTEGRNFAAFQSKYFSWYSNFLGKYNVYRANSSRGPYLKLNDAPINANQFDVGDFLQGYYVVRSASEVTESYSSAELLIKSGEAPVFSDKAAESGTADPQDGFSAAFGDFNNDDYPDLFVAVPSGKNKLYRNNQDGTFTDVSETARITANSEIAIWGDYDNDGDTDLFARRLYRNDGNGIFSDVSDSAGLGDIAACHGASFGDYDNDGNLDLFASQEKPDSCKLFRNNGNSKFTEVSAAADVKLLIAGRESAFADFDNDGDADLVVAAAQPNENRYLRNGGDGTFTDVTTDAGLINSEGETIAVGDYNNDGLLDLIIAGTSGTWLYKNNGAGAFSDVAATVGITGLGDNAVRSAQWADFDNDGYLDLYLINGDSSQTNTLYRNNGGGLFEDISQLAGVANNGPDMKCAVADYDRDGDTDIYIARMSNANILYNNPGNLNHWLTLKLNGTVSNKNGIGTRVKIVTTAGTQIREVFGGTGAHNALPVAFGLGDVSVIDSLIIRWPSGLVNELTQVASNQLLHITEEETNTFTNVAANMGLNNTNATAGFAVADYDVDGDVDLYVFADSTKHLMQYAESPNWSFTFAEMTAQAGVGNDSSGSGPAFIDYNNDGYPDLFLANYGAKVLFRNNGDGTFVDVSATSGITDRGSVNGFAFGDLDNDGYLDLYLANWNSPNVLYKNAGPPHWSFTDITPTAGVGYNGTSHACVFGDYDNDGDVDIYVSVYTAANLLYRNNGDGTFTDVASQAGVAYGSRCRGAVFGDYNNDGYLDIYLTRGRFEQSHANVLFKNNGPPHWNFTEVTATAGVGNTGDGTLSIFGDYNNDGYLDIYVANSGQHVNPQNALYRNNGPPSWNFTEIGMSAGVQAPDYCPSAGFWDYNNDGFLDIFAANSRGPNFLYKNNGNHNHWVKIRLIGKKNNRDGLGARVKVVAGRMVQTREANGDNPGYHSQNSLPLLFGVGKVTRIDSVVVRWPSGLVDVLYNASAGKTLIIAEGMTTGVADQAEPGLPKRYALSQNYPNPFNAETSIEYELPKLSPVELVIYNVMGQKVRILVDKKQEPKKYTVLWDGKNDAGFQIGSGVYFIRMLAGEFTATKKMVVLK